MKKFLKITGIVLLVLIVLTIITGLILHEPLPEGTEGPQAEALARDMLEAIDETAWDSTALIQWSFAGIHHFVWDKKRKLVRVQWDEKKVIFHTSSGSGTAWENGQKLTGSAAEELVDEAIFLFNNDSFWFIAPFKVFDPGVVRKTVSLKDGGKGLLVTYTSGGSTPGDSYLWILDENDRPKAWKMWVSIIPIGGISNNWSDWKELSTGAWVAQERGNRIFTLEISDIKAGMEIADLDLESDPFENVSFSN